MWQGTPNAKTTRTGSGAKGRRRKSNSLSMSRVLAQLKSLTRMGGVAEEEPQPVRIVLNDLTPVGIHLFSRDPLPQGFEILISMSDPKRIDLHGRVMSCQLYNLNSKVIDSQGLPYRYRMRVEFQFATPSEKTSVQEFVTELLQQYLRIGGAKPLLPASPAAAPTEDEGTPEAA